jgi:hypothetical protein
LGQGSLNAVVPAGAPIKCESPYLAPGDENRPPLPSPAPTSCPPVAVDSVRFEPLSQPGRSHQAGPQFNVQDFMTDCALRDFVHERLEGLTHGLVGADADVGKLIGSTVRNFGQHTYRWQEKHRAGLVSQWHAMPSDMRDMYRTRASHFAKTPVVKDRYPAELDRFIKESAGFYRFFFSRRADHDRFTNHFGAGQPWSFPTAFMKAS